MKQKGLIVTFLLFIFGISLVNLFKKDVAFSEFENRPLEQFPKFTLERLISGSFTEKFESYITDQFAQKTFWTGLKAKAEQALFKQENNDVYFGKDHYLFEKPESISKQLQKNIDSVNQLQRNNKDFPVTFTVIPMSIDLYPEKVPPFGKQGMHEKIVSQIEETVNPAIQFINPLETLVAKKNEQIYFRTDHHWTTHAAFYTYQELAVIMGFTPYSLDDFEVVTVSDQFFGTFYAKGNDLTIPPDTIDIFQPKKEIQYQVEADQNYRLEGLYDKSFLDKRDQYAYFLGGNHAKTVIRSSLKNNKKLLLIKDSYAHAIAPFLANHFEEIHMLDLRYYNASIQQYIQENDLTEGLVLYNSPNFAKDRSIIYLKN